MALPTRRLPLTALRSFEAAARHLSFKQAAAELCVSPTTVSNQIRGLERDWGCKLFHRYTRAVTLTERGQALADVLSGAFDEIRAEVDRQLTAARRTVTIAVGPIFGARWLGPRLARFAREHPEIELAVRHGPRIAGAAEMGTDLAVDWGEGAWRGLDAVRLLEVRYSPVASPSLIARHGGLDTPAALAGLPVIHQHDRSEWRNWFALAGCGAFSPSSEIVVEDANMVDRAVADGQGVALGVFPFMEEDVQSGRLVKPFEIDLTPARAFFLLSRPGARERAALRTVCDWIEAEARPTA